MEEESLEENLELVEYTDESINDVIEMEGVEGEWQQGYHLLANLEKHVNMEEKGNYGDLECMEEQI